MIFGFSSFSSGFTTGLRVFVCEIPVERSYITVSLFICFYIMAIFAAGKKKQIIERICYENFNGSCYCHFGYQFCFMVAMGIFCAYGRLCFLSAC